MKKKTLPILCLILVIASLLAGCGDTKLAEGYDKDKIKQTAEEVITEVQLEGAKKVLEERMREDFVDNIDLDTMENTVKDLTSGLGSFIAFSQQTVIGQPHDETKEDLAVILVTVTYEKGEVNYTITFDKELNIVGFYVK